MPAAHEQWKVLPHDPIEHLTENLWRVEGDLEGPPIRRTMFVVRLPDSRLVIHNAMALSEPAMKELEAWGTPSILIVPNGWHRLDARVFLARYPSLKVVCPESARRKVQEVVPVTGVFGDFDIGSPDVVLRHLPGVKHEEGVVEVSSADGLSLLFNDLILNTPRMPGFQGFLYHLMAGSGRPRHHRMVTTMIVKDRKTLRAELLRLASLPALRRVLMAHGTPITERAGEVLTEVARGL